MLNENVPFPHLYNVLLAGLVFGGPFHRGALQIHSKLGFGLTASKLHKQKKTQQQRKGARVNCCENRARMWSLTEKSIKVSLSVMYVLSRVWTFVKPYFKSILRFKIFTFSDSTELQVVDFVQLSCPLMYKCIIESQLSTKVSVVTFSHTIC